MNRGPAATASGKDMPVAVRLLLCLGLLFLFLVAIKLMGSSFKLMGSETATSLFDGVSNPFAGLAVGMLATVLVQSSSVTTATIVSIVAADPKLIPVAVPMVMGANIGTSVTNTIVALGHMRRSEEFQRAFAGATMHDFFNLLAVAIFLPIEIATHGMFSSHAGGWITESAYWLAGIVKPGFDASMTTVAEAAKGSAWKSPISASVKSVAKIVQGWVVTDSKAATGMEVGTLLLAGLGGIFTTLIFITKNMKKLMAAKAEAALNAVLRKSGVLGILVGALLTVAVQSSSITTSLLIPMFAAGILTLENGFPITLGANIGTTITALLAAVVSGPAGLVIALAHLVFNAAATLLLYPIPAVRHLPVNIAKWLAARTATNRMWAVGYVVVTFILVPLTGMLIFKD